MIDDNTIHILFGLREKHPQSGYYKTVVSHCEMWSLAEVLAKGILLISHVAYVASHVAYMVCQL